MDTILDSLLTPQWVYVRKTLGNVNNIRERENKNPNFFGAGRLFSFDFKGIIRFVSIILGY